MHEAAEDSEGGFWDGIIGMVVLFGGIWLVGNISNWYSETKKAQEEQRRKIKSQNGNASFYKNSTSITNSNSIIKLNDNYPISKVNGLCDSSSQIVVKKGITENERKDPSKELLGNEPIETEYGTTSADGKIFIKGKDIENIKIPEGIEIIEKYAFSSLKKLCEVSLPSSLKQINMYAFQYSSIKNIRIPANVEVVAQGAFWGCEKLISVFFEGKESRLGINIFCDCMSLEDVKLPNNLKYIPESTFEGCISLQEICIPDTVIKIGKAAFCDCHELKEIDLPNSVTYIGRWAFRCCYELKHFKFPPKVVGIANYMFCDDFNLRYVELHNNITCIMDSAFANCSVLRIRIPESLSILDRYAFSQCREAVLYVPSNKVQWVKDICKINTQQIRIYEPKRSFESNLDLEEKTKSFLYEQKIEKEDFSSAVAQELGLSDPFGDYYLFDKDDF